MNIKSFEKIITQLSSNELEIQNRADENYKEDSNKTENNSLFFHPCDIELTMIE